MQEKHSDNSARVELLRQISSVFLGIAGLCFVIGLLIVNIRLVRYGIYSSGFIRTEYILVGAFCIFILAFMRVAMSFGISIAKNAWDALLKRSYVLASAKLILSIPFLILMPIFALLFLCSFNLDLLSWNIWVMLGILFIGNHYMDELYSGLLSIGDHVKKSSDQENGANNRTSQLIDIFLPLLYLIIWLTLYANYVYPNISPAMGGGHRDKVLVAPTQAGIVIFRNIGFPFSSDSLSVGPIEILTESQDEIVLLLPDGSLKHESYHVSAIRVKKTLINGIINVTSRP